MAISGNPEATLQAQAPKDAANEDRVPSLPPTAPQSSAPPRSGLSKLSGILQIGYLRTHHSRYARLKSQELFDRLVSIYTIQFQTHYRAFKYAFYGFDLPADVQKPHAAALAYISSWFWDLHATIQRCVLKTSFIAHSERYPHHIELSQHRYDPFLQHLNSVIRPTHTQLSLDDCLWIPYISEKPVFPRDDETHNPFGLNGWYMNEAFVQAILDVMDNKDNNWRTVVISDNNTLGRPMWLLDWHNNEAYAWFPNEGNFSNEDLVAPYILGIPCTPNFGSRDSDDWQIWPNNARPAHIPANLERATPRCFNGSAEYRSVDTREYLFPFEAYCEPSSNRGKRPRTMPPMALPEPQLSSPSVEVGETSHLQQRMDTDPQPIVLNQFRITDWCYRAKVVDELNPQIQSQALRMFLFTA